MKYKLGDKLFCVKTINNIIDKPLFIKGLYYEILGIDDDRIILNHILYANEYGDFSVRFVNENFLTLKELRKQKLLKIGINFNK